MALRDSHGRFSRTGGGGVVRSVDHGYDALLRRVYGFGAPRVAMGILAKDAQTPHKGEASATMLDVANWMEFGFVIVLKDGREIEVPARSFIRGWWDEASPAMRRDFGKLMQSVLAGKRTKEDILELIGQRGQGQIQARIAAGIKPENKPSTIERKGSSVPLIDEGQLRSTVSYAVREGGGGGT